MEKTVLMIDRFDTDGAFFFCQAPIPLGCLKTPDEVASVVTFLASNESSYLTGITIDVSGDRYLR